VWPRSRSPSTGATGRVTRKHLHPEWTQNAEIVQRFVSEARADQAPPGRRRRSARRWSCHRPDGHKFIVLELLDGQPVSKWIRHPEPPADRVVHARRTGVRLRPQAPTGRAVAGRPSPGPGSQRTAHRVRGRDRRGAAWTREDALEQLRRWHRAGKSIRAASIAKHDASLYKAARRLFGSHAAAIRAAGVSATAS